MDPKMLMAMISAARNSSGLGSGISQNAAYEGIAPYGIRYADSLSSQPSAKGMGYFGMVPSNAGGGGIGASSSELSSSFEQGGKTIEHPLMVPTLNAQELQHLLSGAEPTDAIYKKAQDHALMRIGQGLSPFSGPQDLRYPVPK
jgi:hypothetical protein